MKFCYSLFMFCFLGYMSCNKPTDFFSPRQIGIAEADTMISFDAIHDNNTGITHFVYRNGLELFHMTSKDKGRSWSEPVKIFDRMRCPDMQMDTKGRIHMVMAKSINPWDDADGVYHSVYENGKWGPLDSIFDRKESYDGCTRYTIDKNDNIHMLVWSFYWPDSLNIGECLMYFKKSNNSEKFEGPVYWCDKATNLTVGHGAVTTAPNGDVHFIAHEFVPNSGDEYHLQYRVLKTDGTWSEVKRFRQMSHNMFAFSDWCHAIAVDNNNKLIIATFTSWGDYEKGKQGRTVWSYTPGADSLTTEMFVPEFWEPGGELLVMPNNDVYLASGNWGWDKKPHAELFKGSYFAFNSKNNTWGARRHVSENDSAINVLTRLGDMGPRLISIDNNPVIVYAEKLPGEKKFKFYIKGITNNKSNE